MNQRGFFSMAGNRKLQALCGWLSSTNNHPSGWWCGSYSQPFKRNARRLRHSPWSVSPVLQTAHPRSLRISQTLRVSWLTFPPRQRSALSHGWTGRAPVPAARPQQHLHLWRTGAPPKLSTEGTGVSASNVTRKSIMESAGSFGIYLNPAQGTNALGWAFPLAKLSETGHWKDRYLSC